MTKAEYKTLSQLFHYYQYIIEENKLLFEDLSYRCQAPQLISLCSDAIKNGSTYSVEKMYKWLEFIQGILQCLNLIDIEK